MINHIPFCCKVLFGDQGKAKRVSNHKQATTNKGRASSAELFTCEHVLQKTITNTIKVMFVTFMTRVLYRRKLFTWT